MAEIILMKTLKLIISWYCYLGTAIIAVDQLPGVNIKESLTASQEMQHIIIYMLIVFWIIKIAWFVYDKFHLEAKERTIKMDKMREEITEMKENHKGGQK